MGIPLTVFTLHRLHNPSQACEHYLLLRVEQPAFSNADAANYDRVVALTDAKRAALIDAYAVRSLAHTCPHPHTTDLLGELQSAPVGDLLLDTPGGFDVDLWLAATRFGHPWIVLGVAPTESDFWQAVAADPDLTRLDPRPPAHPVRAYFIAETPHA